MATVKGDVHDIGKNIVGVVLQCNNYEVIDLGVMVPADRILDEAVAHKVDMVGLSGLITPSLDEMVFVAGGDGAARLQHPAADRRRHHQPHPHRGEDRAGVQGGLDHLCAGRQPRRGRGLGPAVAHRQGRGRAGRDPRRNTSRSASSSPAAARPSSRTTLRGRARQRLQDRLDRLQPPRSPSFIGTRTFDGLRPGGARRAHIDWSPFFASWELIGRFPHILEDDVVGEAARASGPTPSRSSTASCEELLLEAQGVVGFWPANADGDDIVLFDRRDAARPSSPASTPCASRWARRAGKPNTALSDFIAPVGQPDYLGAFAVTAGHGETRLADEFRAQGRRLFGHHRHRPGRPPGRGLRRAHAPAGAHRALGLCAGRAARPRRS